MAAFRLGEATVLTDSNAMSSGRFSSSPLRQTRTSGVSPRRLASGASASWNFSRLASSEMTTLTPLPCFTWASIWPMLPPKLFSTATPVSF